MVGCGQLSSKDDLALGHICFRARGQFSASFGHVGRCPVALKQEADHEGTTIGRVSKGFSRTT